MAESETAEPPEAFEGAPEEPLFVERPDGMRHLPPVRAYALLGLLRAGTDLYRDLSTTLENAHGLSLHAFEVLLHLAAFSPDGSLRLAQLADQAPLSQSRVSRLVAQLDAQGLVARASAPDDARAVDVTITDAGLALFHKAQETHLADLNQRVFARLTWQEVIQLATITAKLMA